MWRSRKEQVINFYFLPDTGMPSSSPPTGSHSTQSQTTLIMPHCLFEITILTDTSFHWWELCIVIALNWNFSTLISFPNSLTKQCVCCFTATLSTPIYQSSKEAIVNFLLFDANTWLLALYTMFFNSSSKRSTTTAVFSLFNQYLWVRSSPIHSFPLAGLLFITDKTKFLLIQCCMCI